jgi:hypothetical protein
LLRFSTSLKKFLTLPQQSDHDAKSRNSGTPTMIKTIFPLKKSYNGNEQPDRYVDFAYHY